MNNIKGLIYIFDASNIKTLFHIQKYLEGLASEMLKLKALSEGRQDPENTQLPLLIIGNKSDLLDEHIKGEKMQIISDYIKGIFSDAELNCLFLSNSKPYDQFKGFDKFLQTCVGNDHKNLMFYSLKQKFYCYEGFTAYALRKFNSLTMKIMRAQKYFSLKMIQFYSMGLAIAVTYKEN